jgi:ABC-type transport system involved in cytochrome bd biosynthesis fused ATPase/permease subunit
MEGLLAFFAESTFILLDEPSRHLDAATVDAVLQAVLDRAVGRSLLRVTHRPEELASFAEVRSLTVAPE